MSLTSLPRLLVLFALLFVFLAPQTGALADEWDDCESKQPDRVIPGCTAIINDGTEKKEDMADAYYYRGSAYSKKEDYNSAISDFTQAIALDPNDSDAYNRRGIAYRKKGDLDGAIADYNQAIKLDPSHPNAFKNRDKALRLKGGSSGGTAPPVRRAAREGDLEYDLQEELKYIGCYTGSLDGIWGPRSQSALNRFIDLVGTSYARKPSQYVLDAVRNEKKGYCKPVRVAPKRTKPKGCRSGTVFLEGQCIPRSQVRSFCGPGFERSGSRCVEMKSDREKPAVRKKARCSSIKFAFTRGNSCACSGGRIFTGSACVRPQQSAPPPQQQTCTPGQTRKADGCRFQCVCTGLVTCNWVADVCE